MAGATLKPEWIRWRRKRRDGFCRAGASTDLADDLSRVEAEPRHRVAHCSDPTFRSRRCRNTGCRSRGYFL